MLEEHGIRVPNKDRLTGRDIGRMIRLARRKANAEALIQRIMGLIERAVYEVKDHEDVAEALRPGAQGVSALHLADPALPRSGGAPLAPRRGEPRSRSRGGAAHG